MKSKLARLSIVSTLIVGPLAHAATSITNPGFSLSLLSSTNAGVDMEVIKTRASNGYTNEYTIALRGAETDAVSVRSDMEMPEVQLSDDQTRLAFSVTPGYFIHDLTLEISYTGSLSADLPAPPCTIWCNVTDYAYSRGSARWALTQGSTTSILPDRYSG